MSGNKNINIGPKYRICTDNTENGENIVFFCDWEYIKCPEMYFIGKPVYFEGNLNLGIDFAEKHIDGFEYRDISKIKPNSVYMCDIGLKCISSLLSNKLLSSEINNTCLQTLCLVSKSSIVCEIDCIRAKEIINKSDTNAGNLTNIVKMLNIQKDSFGIVGYHALNPNCLERDYDLVLFFNTLKEMNLFYKRFKKVNSNNNIYIDKLWPLTKRFTNGITLDLFMSSQDVLKTFLCDIYYASIQDWHHEFSVVITDTSMGLFSTPAWQTDQGQYLVSVDNAVRGRLNCGNIITGVGILASIGDKSIIVLQSEKNMFIG